jgi:hypothetical protein
MSLEKTTSAPENTGIDLGKETVGVSKGRVQELVDGGMSMKDATSKAIREVLNPKESPAANTQDEQESSISTEKPATEKAAESTESKKARESEIKSNIEETIATKHGPIIGVMMASGSEKDRAAPSIKIEGETYTTDDGRAVVIESEEGGVCKARLLTPTEDDIRRKQTVIDIPRGKIESKAVERRDKMVNEYANRFGFSKEDYLKLESNPEYQKLSHGEKKFVLDSFSSATLEKIDENADEKFKNDMAKKGFLGRIGHNITKETRLAKARKETFKEIRNGGYDKHKDTIESIISRAGAMGVPMIENEKGELEMQYSAQLAGFIDSNSRSERAKRAFDQAATALQNIPPEWEGEFATNRESSMAKKIRDEYDATRNAYFNHRTIDPRDAGTADIMMRESSIIDGKIGLNRMMNAHSDNERVLNSLNKSMGKQVFTGGIKDLFTKDYRLAYAGGGAAARLATKYFNAFSYGLEGMLASTVVVSGISGAIRGRMMARKQIREEEKMLRRGGERTKIGEKVTENINGKNVSVGKKSDMLKLEEKDETKKDETKGDSVIHRGYISKIDFIIKKIEQADQEGDPVKASMYANMLKNRVDHALDRAAKGKVTFGDKNVRTGNQAAFYSAINSGLAYSKAADPNVNNRFKARMNRVLKVDEKDQARYKEQKNFVRNYAIRNAAIGMTLGGIGFTVMHHILESGGQQAVDTAHETARESLHAPYSPTPINDAYETAAPDNTYVATHPPTEDLGLHSDHNIEKMLPGSHEIKPSISDDAFINKGEGVEHALRRQIEHNPEFAKNLGYKGDINDSAALHKFSGNAAHKLAIDKGIVNPETGKEDYIKWDGEKAASAEIKIGSDGKLNVEVKGSKYLHDSISQNTRAMHPNKSDEFIFKDGHKVGVINYPELEVPSPSIDDHPELMQEIKEINPDYGNEVSDDEITNTEATETEVVKETTKAQPGKRLVSEDVIEQPKKLVDKSYRTHTGGYKTTIGEKRFNPYEYGQGGNVENVGRVGGQIGEDGIMRSPRGTVMKEVITNGRTWYLDTHSFDPDFAFDGRVHRQYDRLVGDMFGKRDNLTGDIVIDRNMSNMLMKHMAEDDISAVPAPNASEQVKDYLQLVKEIHEASGLEPKENVPTATYLKQALQHMKNEGKNIRRFVSMILDEEVVENGAMHPGGVPKFRNSDVVDDVYR